MIDKHKLIELNKRGLIYAPDELERHFAERCQKAIACNQKISSWVIHTFDVNPDWVHFTYENKGLRFWEGGCTWINGTQVTIQLRKIFEKQSFFLGYGRDEVMAHEIVHLVRCRFEEPIFEEVLAYQSSSTLRRLFAPIFRTPQESIYFLLSSFVCLAATFFPTFQKFALLGFCGLSLAALVRLLLTQRTFARAKKQLSQTVGKEKVLAVMLRLTDREIIRFSKMGVEAINAYASKMSKRDMRWAQIISYFSVYDAG